MEHKESALIPDGRILIDTEQSFVYREGGLEGVLMAARLSGLSPNLASRFTPGTLISSYETCEAVKRGIAVPFRKSDPEQVRKLSALQAADRGGLMFQPEPGTFENVEEIDFTSMYPSIIVKANLSPETIGHSERHGFLPEVLKPLLDLRFKTKQSKKPITGTPDPMQSSSGCLSPASGTRDTRTRSSGGSRCTRRSRAGHGRSCCRQRRSRNP